MSAGRKPALTAAHVERARRRMPDLGTPPGTEQFTDADYRALCDHLLQSLPAGQDLLVFAYGSLIWKPACAAAEQRPATLTGWHRSFCFRIVRYRGCDEQPGLMMSLERGGSCKGVVQRFAAADTPRCLEQLVRREHSYKPSSHKPIWVKVTSGGERVAAITWVIDRSSRNYMPGLSEDEKAAMIAAACGARGPCAEYLLNTVEHLEALGIHDPYLWRLQKLVAERIGEAAGR
jgi:cation transport protein ChaC